MFISPLNAVIMFQCFCESQILDAFSLCLSCIFSQQPNRVGGRKSIKTEPNSTRTASNIDLISRHYQKWILISQFFCGKM